MAAPTPDQLLQLSSLNAQAEIEDMTNAEYETFVKTISTEPVRQSLLRKLATAQSPILQTRRNRLRNLERTIQAKERRAREARHQALGQGIPPPTRFAEVAMLGPTPVTPLPATELAALLDLPPQPFQARIQSMTNAEYASFLNSISTEEVRQQVLQRLNGVQNQGLLTRRNKVRNIEQKVLTKERVVRNKTRPAVSRTPPRETGIFTMANLEKRQEKDIFVSVSYIPYPGVRPYTQKIEGETLVESTHSRVRVKQDPQQGIVFFVELDTYNGMTNLLLLPIPIPEVKEGQIVRALKKDATPILTESGEQKKKIVQHKFQKNGKDMYSITYEANLYFNKEKAPFFYYLNQQEFRENAEDGIPIYDIPYLPSGFLFGDKI